MSEIADFLRARYTEARTRANGRVRMIPSVFDGHCVEILHEFEGERLLVDGHPFPTDRYMQIATEPAPDPDAIADCDAKLAIVDHYEKVQAYAEVEQRQEYVLAAGACAVALKHLAQRFAGHPDHKGQEWAP